MNSGAVATGKDGKMKEEEKEARELIERIKKLGLNDATIGEMVDEIERLRAKTDDGATVPCSGGLVDIDPTEKQIWSACLSFRHDFGLMEYREKESLRFQAIEWLRAWQKEFGLR